MAESSSIYNCVIKQLLDSAFGWYEELSRPRSMLSAEAFDRGVDNSWHHAQLNPTIVNYTIILSENFQVRPSWPMEDDTCANFEYAHLLKRCNIHELNNVYIKLYEQWATSGATWTRPWRHVFPPFKLF